MPAGRGRLCAGAISERAVHLIDPPIPLLEAGEAWVDSPWRAPTTHACASAGRAPKTQLALSLLGQRRTGRASHRNLPAAQDMVGRGSMRLEVMSRGGLVEAADEIAGSIPWLNLRDLAQPGAIPVSEAPPSPGARTTSWHCNIACARVHWQRNSRE